MDKKQSYTALSRTTNLEYIQLSNKKPKYKHENPPFMNMESTNSYFNDDYHNGQIYIFNLHSNTMIKCMLVVHSGISKQGYKSTRLTLRVQK